MPLARFETSHVLGALLASSPLLANAWDRCVAATAAASDFVHGDGGGRTVYVAFSRVQAALSEAVGAGTMAGSGADAFTLVGLGGEAARHMFFPLVAAEPGPDSGEPIAVQALALKSFLKLSVCPDFKVTD